jgi:hypothetical protein
MRTRSPRHSLSWAFALAGIVLAALMLAACTPISVPLPATATLTPTETPTPLPTATLTLMPTPTFPPVIVETPADSDAALAATATPVASGPQSGDPYELVLSEAQINESTQQALAQQPNVPISNVYVRLEPGQLIAGGKALLGLFTFDVQAAATVSVQDGAAIPQITEIWVGGQPATGIVRTQLLNMLQPYLNQLTEADLPVTIDSVDITKGQMVITGQYK